jgi:hypothetical protein
MMQSNAATADTADFMAGRSEVMQQAAVEHLTQTAELEAIEGLTPEEEHALFAADEAEQAKA